MVNDRYEVFATHGRGVFSSVLRARDRHRKAPDGSVAEVAIKIIRANETMHKVQSWDSHQGKRAVMSRRRVSRT